MDAIRKMYYPSARSLILVFVILMACPNPQWIFGMNCVTVNMAHHRSALGAFRAGKHNFRG